MRESERLKPLLAERDAGDAREGGRFVGRDPPSIDMPHAVPEILGQPRRLDGLQTRELAEQARTEHEAVSSALRDGLRHALAAGAILLKAKAGLPHGSFGYWLEKEVAPQVPRHLEPLVDLLLRDVRAFARLTPGLTAEDAREALNLVCCRVQEEGVELIRSKPAEPARELLAPA
jgi:hypothetical protein